MKLSLLNQAFVAQPAGMLRPVFFLFAVLVASAARAEIISIAAASNFSVALDALHAEFKKYAPKASVLVATGASGSIVAQVRNGAPYDVFLSADLDFPKALIKDHEADAKSLTTFATGRLVLWTTRPRLELKSVAGTLRDPAVKKIAIANIDTAPYGRAARSVLEKLDLWTELKARIVVGENVTQAAQFVETGAADLGFVAMAAVLSPKLKHQGRWIEVPAEAYPPMVHAAVLTNRGAKKTAAKEYLEFLRTPMAQDVLKRYGYGPAPR
ncbi:MAG: molybdate ABC transporter substrate-binding protein [Verrucomicrobia bacterium]|nr:molybdate ABC transporter substrate-binding protein [Verrucomicrobiota bacterium]